MELLQRLAKEHGLLIVIALHDLGHALRFADAAMAISNGSLVACGPTAKVITPALLRKVFDVEARIEPCSKGLPQLIVEGRAAVSA